MKLKFASSIHKPTGSVGHSVIALFLICAAMAIYVSCARRPDFRDPSVMMEQAVKLRSQGKAKEAIELIEKIAVESKNVFGSRSRQYGASAYWLAQGYADMMELRVADSLFLLSESILSKYSDTDSLLAEVYLDHGMVQFPQHEYETAEELLKRSTDHFLKVLEPCNPRLQRVLDVQAGLELFRDSLAAAVPYYERFLKCRLLYNVALDSLTLVRAGELFGIYCVLGRFESAELLGRELIAQDDSTKITYAGRYAEMYVHMGIMYKRTQRPDSALTYLGQGTDFIQRHGDSLSAIFIQSISSQAQIHFEQSNFEQAELCYSRATRLAQHAFGTSSPEYGDAKADLAEFFRQRKTEKKAKEIERKFE